MLMKIVQAGVPVLRQPAQPLTVEQIRSRETKQLIEAMRETMYGAPGVGLAAPQLGLPLQIAVIEDKAEYMKDVPPENLRERGRTPVPFQVIINPTITPIGSTTAEFFEGCLSLTGFTAVVPRALMVKVEYLNQQGQPTIIEASGWYARILQHEIDHLQGTLYIDRMHSRTFMGMESFNEHWKNKSLRELKSLLR